MEKSAQSWKANPLISGQEDPRQTRSDHSSSLDSQCGSFTCGGGIAEPDHPSVVRRLPGRFELTCQHPWCTGYLLPTSKGLCYVIPPPNPLSYLARNRSDDTHILLEDKHEDRTDDCMCFRCIIKNLHESHSQLSGSHGEWTQEDDLADRHNAARRVRQEARNHLHRRPVNGGRPAEREQVDRIPPQAGVAPPPPDRPAQGRPEPIIRYYIQSRGLIFAGDQLRAIEGERTVLGGSPVQDVVKATKYWVDTQVGKGETVYTSPIIGTYHVPAFTKDGQFFPQASYDVFVPLAHALMRQLAGRQSNTTATAATTVVAREFPSLMGTPLAQQTLDYHVMISACVTVLTAYRGNVQRLFGTTAAYDTAYLTDLRGPAMLEGEHPMPGERASRFNGVDCEQPIDFLRRDDFIVTSSRGTTWDHVRMDTPSPALDPPFEFETTHSIRHRFYRTRFFSFLGMGRDPFVQYENNGHNCARAIKRLIGARAEQRALQSAQQQLIPLLWAQYDSVLSVSSRKALEEILHAMSTDHNGVTARWGKQLHPVGDVPLAARLSEATRLEAQKTIVKFHVHLIGECNRETLALMISRYYTEAKWSFQEIWEGCLHCFAPEFSRASAAEISSINRAFRREIYRRQQEHTDGRIMVSWLAAKIKNETAKVGKMPRFYTSYSDGCLYESALPEFVKKCVDGWHVLPSINGFTGAVYIMSVAKTSVLQEVFTQVFEQCYARNSYLAVIFSDDCVEFFNDAGRIRVANTDISSNDSSNGAYPFAVWGMCCGQFNTSRTVGLLQQLMLPITIRNPSNEAQKLSVSFIGPFEGSGTVATTGVNHINTAGTCVGSYVYFAHHPQEPISALVAAGAAVCGHEKTVQECHFDGHFVPEKVQFLKYSFLECSNTEGEVRRLPVRNIGAVLRNFGQVDGDLEPRHLAVSSAVFATMGDEERSHRFFSSVVAGYKHSPGCIIMDALRKRFAGESLTDDVTIVEADDDLSAWTVLPDSLTRRYDTSEADLGHLAHQIERTRAGFVYTSPAMSDFLRVDYG